MVGGRLVADGSVAEHRLCDLSHVDPTDETEAPLVLFADRCRSDPVVTQLPLATNCYWLGAAHAHRYRGL